MRPDRLSPRTNAVRDYLRALAVDASIPPEDRAHMNAQGRALLREFAGASVSELYRLRCALELLEVGRNRTRPWSERGPALAGAARILQALGVVPRRHRGAIVEPTRRKPRGGAFAAPSTKAERPRAAGGNDA